MKLSEDAQGYAEILLGETVSAEYNDWVEFQSDTEGDDHPVHRARELLAFVTGGRFPEGNSHRFTSDEFEAYMLRSCSHQVSTMERGSNNFCYAPVVDPESNDVTPEALCCEEHASDMREEGYTG